MSMMTSQNLLKAFGLLHLFAFAVFAVPTSLDSATEWKSKASSGFSISQVKNPNYVPHLVNVTDLYTKTLSKYKVAIPGSVRDRDTSTGSVLEERWPSFQIAGSFDGAEYNVPIQFGTPPVTLYVAFDTGSSDLWIFSDAMPASETSGHTVYSASSSSTSLLYPGQNFSIGYGSGTVSGDVTRDVLTIGAATVDGYPMETALQVSSSFASDTSMDGIWGMDTNGYQASQGPALQATYRDIAETNGITLFTVNLVYYGAGTITFGTLDSAQYTGSISYTPDVSNLAYWESFWGVNTVSYSVGMGSSTTFAEGVILDTGTTYTYFPASVIAAYWAQVANSLVYEGNYWFPCNATLPDFHINLQGGATATIHGRYLNPYGLGYMDPNFYCQGGLQDSVDLPFPILGLALYQSMFVVFDYGASRVGFASKTLTV